jgi:hypothetical protein
MSHLRGGRFPLPVEDGSDKRKNQPDDQHWDREAQVIDYKQVKDAQPVESIHVN